MKLRMHINECIIGFSDERYVTIRSRIKWHFPSFHFDDSLLSFSMVDAAVIIPLLFATCWREVEWILFPGLTTLIGTVVITFVSFISADLSMSVSLNK